MLDRERVIELLSDPRIIAIAFHLETEQQSTRVSTEWYVPTGEESSLTITFSGPAEALLELGKGFLFR